MRESFEYPVYSPHLFELSGKNFVETNSHCGNNCNCVNNLLLHIHYFLKFFFNSHFRQFKVCEKET